jgi:hypothetical protein
MSNLDRIRSDVTHGFPVSNGDALELIEERDEMEGQLLAARNLAAEFQNRFEIARSSSRARERTIAVLSVQLETAQSRLRILARELENEVNGAVA